MSGSTACCEGPVIYDLSEMNNIDEQCEKLHDNKYRPI